MSQIADPTATTPDEPTPTDAEPVGTSVNLSATQLHFEGKPDPALQGAVGLRLRNGGIAAARVQAVQPEDEAGYAVPLTLHALKKHAEQKAA